MPRGQQLITLIACKCMVWYSSQSANWSFCLFDSSNRWHLQFLQNCRICYIYFWKHDSVCTRSKWSDCKFLPCSENVYKSSL